MAQGTNKMECNVCYIVGGEGWIEMGAVSYRASIKFVVSLSSFHFIFITYIHRVECSIDSTV